MKARFREWADQYPFVGDVRGLGAMVAMELVADRQSRTPDKAVTARILAAALARGLVLLSAGTYGNVIRVLAPLTADDSLIDEGLAVFGAALEAVAGRAPPLGVVVPVALDRLTGREYVPDIMPQQISWIAPFT